MTTPTLADYQFAVEPCLMASTDNQWSYIREPVLRRMPDGTLYCTFLTGGAHSGCRSCGQLVDAHYAGLVIGQYVERITLK